MKLLVALAVYLLPAQVCFAQALTCSKYLSGSMSLNNEYKIVRCDSRFFCVEDLENPYFKFEAHLNSEKVLEIVARLKSPKFVKRSSLLGRLLYEDMINHYGLKNINYIKGYWIDETNHQQFFEGKEKGLSDEEAALSTWSGQQAASYGFSKMHSISIVDGRENSKNKEVHVYFMRPPKK